MALELFKCQAEEVNANLDGFTNRLEAFQFFLKTYAGDQYLEDTLEKIDKLTQSVTEEVMYFYRRLIKHARNLGRVFTKVELMNRLQRGINAKLRPFLRTARKSFSGANALAELVEYSSAIIQSHQAIQTKESTVRIRALLVEEVEQDNRPITRTRPNAVASFPDPIALSENALGLLPPYRTSTATIEYSSDASEAVSISFSAENETPDPLTGQQPTWPKSPLLPGATQQGSK